MEKQEESKENVEMADGSNNGRQGKESYASVENSHKKDSYASESGSNNEEDEGLTIEDKLKKE